MATDDERREVARRLREYVDLPDDWWQETCAEFYVEKCVFGNVDRHSEAELFTRLADLIEPSESGQNLDKNRDTVQIESPAVQKAPECDREALLALADKLECDGDCNGCDMGGGIWCGAQVYAARRIREALGVSDD